MFTLQTALVIITFTLAMGYIVKKFVWTPMFENRKKSIGTVDGGNTKCGNTNCGCH